MDKKYHIDYCFIREPISFKDTILIQLGRLYCAGETVIQKHAHMNWFELTLVTDGEGTIITNDLPSNVSKGDIYISYPGDFHEIRSSKEKPLKYDFFSFNTKNRKIKKELKKIVLNRVQPDLRIFQNEQINSSVQDAIAELSSKQEYYEQILSSLFEKILYYVVRSLSVDNPVSINKHTLSSEELCYQIMHYIDTHIYSIENLSVLSEKFNYNYSYLSDMFSKTTGNTLASYYQARRLDAARLLVKEGKLKINKIAEMLNYSSMCAFSKAFKNKYGVSPKNYSNLKSDCKN